MLPAQVSFWALTETKRHNEAVENLTREQNVISKQQADAASSQAETAKRNAEINAMNASTNAQNANTNAFNALVNQQNADINARNAETNRINAATKAREVEYNYEIDTANVEVNKKNATTNRMNALTNEGYLQIEKQKLQPTIDKLVAETSYTIEKTQGQKTANYVAGKEASYAGAQALGNLVNTWSSATGLKDVGSNLVNALVKIGGAK